jgi:GTP-binding protein
MLVDDVRINVIAGNGGEGANTFIGVRKGVKFGPSGGDGGRGGNIYFLANNNENDLSRFQNRNAIKAQHGAKGLIKNHNGKDASDIIVLVPVGTKIKDEKYDRDYEITDIKNPVLIAKGGEGELGSYNLTKKAGKQTVKRIGQNTTLHLTLTLIADIGLIGLPNAGKSSLLKALTNAQPKIGDYQFTTLEPNLGVLNKLILADIPGLIEGASEGKGLGIKFLKHIEKTKVLLHCIAANDENSLESYQTVREEFSKYNKELLDKKEIILLTKKDLVTHEELETKIKLFKEKEILTVSIYDEGSLEILKNKIIRI